MMPSSAGGTEAIIGMSPPMAGLSTTRNPDTGPLLLKPSLPDLQTGSTAATDPGTATVTPTGIAPARTGTVPVTAGERGRALPDR